MSTSSDLNTDSNIVSEACSWIAQIESGSLSAADLATLREWMNRSPAHTAEIRHIAEISLQLSALTELVEPLEQSAGIGSSVRKSTHRKLLATPIVAAASLCAFIAMAALFSYRSISGDSPNIYITDIGQYKTIELLDGTTVKLNTSTQIEVDYSTVKRRVRLIYGEALFDVAKDKTRPFVVYSDSAIAEAVGTSFVVRLRDAVTELAVVEGIVAFSKLPITPELVEPENNRGPEAIASQAVNPDTQTVIVKAGQVLSSDLLLQGGASVDAVIPTISLREIQRKLSWTEGLLEFSKTPLEEVIAEVTRHNDLSIEIVDPSLKDLKFGGIFRTGDLDPLLEALAGLGVEIEHVDDDRILLRHAESG